MKEDHLKSSKLRRRLSRLFLWFPVFLVAVGLVIFSVLQIPKLQTKLLNKLSYVVSDNTGFDVRIGYANLTWFDHMVLKNVRLFDHQNDSTLIRVKQIHVNFKLYDFLVHRELNADKLTLEQPIVHVIKESDSTEVNISRFISDLKNIFKKNRKNNEKKTSLIIDRINIENGLFSYNDLRKDSLIWGKDYYHFTYDSLNASVVDFNFINDSIGMQVLKLAALDQAEQLHVRHFKGHFSFTKKQMNFSGFDLQTDKSHLKDSLQFSYAHPSDFKYFIDSIKFSAQLYKSKISTDELALFNAKLEELHETIAFSGRLEGSVKRLKVNKFDLSLGQRTHLHGHAKFYGLPVAEETFMDISIDRSLIEPRDIVNMIAEKYQKEVENIGRMDFKGHFLGFTTDFVADGQIISSVGEVSTDINFKIGSDNKARYSGSLDLNHFDLRSIFHEQQQLKYISLRGQIKGSGLRLDNANFTLNAHIDSLAIKDYTYADLSTDGQFTLGFFGGKLACQDPNLTFAGQLEVDLREERNKINVSVKLDTANLLPLGLTNEPVSIASKIDIKVKGLKLDELVGYASLSDNILGYRGKSIHIDSLKVLSSLVSDTRIIHLETDGLTCEMNGEYKNSVFLKTIREFYRELKLNILNQKEPIEKYYAKKSTSSLEKFHVKIDLNLWDINKFIQPFIPSFDMSKAVKIRGTFVQDSTSRLNLFGSVDSLKIHGVSWIKNHFDLNVAKEYFGTSTIGSSLISSNKQIWSERYQSENAFSKIFWYEDSMYISVNLEQPDLSNRLALQSAVHFFTDSTEIHFLPSDMEILGKSWTWDDQNKVIFQNNSWSFQHASLFNQIEQLEISGYYSDEPGKALFIDVKELELQNLQALLTKNVEGTVDGRIKIKKQPENDLIEGNLIARALKIEDLLIGNLFALSRWESAEQRLALNLDLVQNGRKKIAMGGAYYPRRTDEQLDLIARVDSADLKISEPFLKKNFTEIGGLTSGEFSINGNLRHPILKGKGKILGGEVLVNYLNTRYTFEGDLNLTENEIEIAQMEIRDAEQNPGQLSGSIAHNQFRNLTLDVQGSFENLQLLNTTNTDNSAYYGVAYGTGKIKFQGAIENIKITAEAQTAKGTRLYIPLGESSSKKIEQKEYIEFVELKNKNVAVATEKVIKNEKVKIKGIELDLDLEFSTEAYVELIFDVQAGDIIRGRGNGNIKLLINTDGDFTMFGDYTIESGGYNFTLYNIINKEFDIKKGSTISWYGNPYGANLNISASYRQLASLGPLMERFLDPNDLNSPETRKKYPSIVDLYLKGNLLTPTIKFGVNIQDYPLNTKLPNSSVTLEEVVTAFQANLRNNEQEMNRQVFSLIILRKFSPENTFQVNSQTLGNSLSEFVSNQLSYWATQVDENLEVDVDLAGLTDDAYNTFQLRLSYTFFNGRLRVSRGGNLPNEENKGNVASVIGDWTVEYLLTEDGRFRVKMYSRSNLNTVDQQSQNENNFETGFSLQYVKSFDQLKQILSDNREKNILKKDSGANLKDEEKEI